MNAEWMMQNKHILYTDINYISQFFESEMMTSNISQSLLDFKSHPCKNGVNMKAGDGSNLTLFIPDMYFENQFKHVAMGDAVWIYIEEYQQFCCVYIPS